jgi:hypothetical protein
MNDPAYDKTMAARATSERFLKVAIGEDSRYPNGSAFVASSVDGLEKIIQRNLREGRSTVIVHDDGSDVVIEPPGGRMAALLMFFALAAWLGDCAKPEIEAGGEVIQLPAGARLRLHPPGAMAA